MKGGADMGKSCEQNGDARCDEDVLPTSRRAPQRERAVLAVLRAKAPRRALSPAEAAQVAEWQATALLDLAGLTRPPTPGSVIAELPRMRVRFDPKLPVSGCVTWHDGCWLILLNGQEPRTRQRFTLAHEFKHALDHRDRHVLYVDQAGLSAEAQAEQMADYFAACLLMPRTWLKRAWAAGYQRPAQLSRLFGVSTVAMRRRLQHLGLWTGRDDGRSGGRQSATYQRPGRPDLRSAV